MFPERSVRVNEGGKKRKRQLSFLLEIACYCEARQTCVKQICLQGVVCKVSIAW